MSVSLGQKIRKLRIKHGMGQKELADAIGVSHSRISEIENGKSNPTLATLGLLADALFTTVSYLTRE